jgi:hypothetical protein
MQLTTINKLRNKTKYALIAFLLLINIFLIVLLLLPKPKAILQTRNISEDIQYVSESQMSFDELSDYFTLIANENGADYAFNVLKQVSVPPNTDMHLLAHVVGDRLFKQVGVEGIKTCTDDFRNACSHSIVVGLLLEVGVDALDEIAEACREAPGGKGAYTMCFHGLGHGVLAYTNYEMEAAAELCRKTGTEEYGNQEAHQCIGGMMMEMVSGVHDIPMWEKQKGKYLKANDPLYPCSAEFIPDEYKFMCYVYLTPHLFEAAGGSIASPTPENFTKAFTYCDKIAKTVPHLRDACFGGFGKEFVGIAQSRDIRKIDQMNETQLKLIASWCQLSKDKDGVVSCLIHAMNSMYWGGENNPQTAIDFCGVVDLPYQTLCYDTLYQSAQYYTVTPDTKKRFCDLVPTAQRGNCTNIVM